MYHSSIYIKNSLTNLNLIFQKIGKMLFITYIFFTIQFLLLSCLLALYLIDSNLKKEDFHYTTNYHLAGEVIVAYGIFLENIAGYISVLESDSESHKRYKRKYLAVKNELFNYLVAHKKFFELKSIVIMLNNKVIFEIMVSNLDKCDDFLRLEDFQKFNEVFNSDDLTKKYYKTKFNMEKYSVYKILNFVREKLGYEKSDFLPFFENHYLLEKSKFNPKCSTYKELRDYIVRRREDYLDETISSENIQKMSFKFKGSIEDFEEEKSCGICLEDYEKDQEVCHLPCNHFCCRSCTEKMFAIPDDGSDARFQCPLCRDDCT